LSFVIWILLFNQAQNVFALDFTPPPFNDLSFKGQYYNQSVPDPIEIPAGGSQEVIVRFKNAGESVWENTGANYVSVYTVDPNYRPSDFACSNWLAKSQVGKILKTTKPGEIAEVKINLCAPEKLGSYEERFYFASENHTWIKSTYFYLKIKVIATEVNDEIDGDDEDDETPSPPQSSPQVGEEDAGEAEAKILGLQSKYLAVKQGSMVEDFALMYQNLSNEAWDEYELKAELVASDYSLFDSSWESSDVILEKTRKVLSDKDTGWLKFKIKAPPKKGDYDINFYLERNGEKILGSDLKVNLKVATDASNYEEEAEVVLTRELIAEPNIRVRLYQPTTYVKFRSSYDYQVYAGDERKLVLPKNTLVKLSYEGDENGVYIFEGGGEAFSTKEKIRMVPKDMKHYFEIPTLARTITWKGDERFDEYRGIMEYVYSPRDQAIYVVNELPMSSYVAGIGEMSDSSPLEYMKAIMVAARSYAYYHLTNGVPADQRTYDVWASTVDQLYLGYAHEKNAPNAVKAQQETFGEMVTYDREPVVTPYFGHSDGWTRTWKQAWGGTNKEWLQQVRTPHDDGKSMFGHGVGISMDDAAQRARVDGWDYKEILQYYYTGVSVERVY